MSSVLKDRQVGEEVKQWSRKPGRGAVGGRKTGRKAYGKVKEQPVYGSAWG